MKVVRVGVYMCICVCWGVEESTSETQTMENQTCVPDWLHMSVQNLSQIVQMDPKATQGSFPSLENFSATLVLHMSDILVHCENP